MSKEELIKWFHNKINSCYPVVQSECPNSIYMLYDEQIIRKIKLSKISGVELEINKISGVCLFEFDWENNFFYCNYTEIWSFLYENYSQKYEVVQNFISERLFEFDNFNLFTPQESIENSRFSISDIKKFTVLSLSNPEYFDTNFLSNRMSILTPLYGDMKK